MPANSSLDILNLDFDTIKVNLKTFMRSQGAFKDLDYEGSNLNVLIDVLAYNSFYNNFYTNMLASEMFIDSAITRDAIISHAKELNYNPRSSRSSVAHIDVTITPDDNPATITIPKHFPISSSIDGRTFTFRTEAAHVIKQDALGDYIASNVAFYEGKQLTEYYTITANGSQKYKLSNKNIDTRSIELTVRESNTVTTNTSWRKATSLFGEGASSNIFFVAATSDEKWEIQFGDNIVGRKPVAGNIAEIHYRVASKEISNKATSFTTTTNVDGYSDISLLTNIGSTGGANIESLESIRFNAPKTFQIQDRAVTPNDYKIIVQSEFPEVQSIAVYGGEEANPPKYGRVILSVDLTDADGIPESKKTLIKSFLEQRTPVGINVDVVSPDFTYLSISTDVNYNINTTNATPSQIISIVSSAMTTFANTNINTFEKPLRKSKFISTIDESNSNILSNKTTIKPYKKVVPTINSSFTASYRFHNSLLIDGILSSNTSINTHLPAVESSSFTYDSVSAFIIDNSVGFLNIVTNTGGLYQVLNSNIGTVDYNDGIVNINGLIVDSYQGDSIKLKVRTAESDIKTNQNTILQLNGDDITVNVTQERA
jgi:hypothetical protein